MKRLTAMLCLAVLLPGLLACGKTPEIPPTPTTAVTQPTTAPTTQPVPTETLQLQQQELEVLQNAEPALQQVATVEASGIRTKEAGGIVIDYSNAQKGYIMALRREDTDKRMKVRLQGPTTLYTYNLAPEKWTAFPLSDGDGAYQITVYENVEGSKYAAVLSLQLDVTLEDPFGPFLRSNQYVDFDAAPKAAEQAAQLTKGMKDPLQQVAAIYDYVVDSLSYDKELAATVKSGYLPVLDRVLESKKGICFDYAALLTGMLRSRGIPTKLVVGYAGTVYHAWISVWTEEEGWVDGVIWFDGITWKRMDPTFASSAHRSEEIMEFIGDGTNYTAKYVY